MGLFKFRIYDVHKTYSFDESGNFILTANDTELKVFHYYLETDEKQIESFRSDVLIDSDNNATEYTKVTLTSGEILFAAMKVDTFESNYIKDYLSIFKETNKDQKQ